MSSKINDNNANIQLRAFNSTKVSNCDNDRRGVLAVVLISFFLRVINHVACALLITITLTQQCQSHQMYVSNKANNQENKLTRPVTRGGTREALLKIF